MKGMSGRFSLLPPMLATILEDTFNLCIDFSKEARIAPQPQCHEEDPGVFLYVVRVSTHSMELY